MQHRGGGGDSENTTLLLSLPLNGMMARSRSEPGQNRTNKACARGFCPFNLRRHRRCWWWCYSCRRCYFCYHYVLAIVVVASAADCCCCCRCWFCCCCCCCFWRTNDGHGIHNNNTATAMTVRNRRNFIAQNEKTKSNFRTSGRRDQLPKAIKLGFNDTRCVMEPAGALAIAGMRKYLREKGLVGHSVSQSVMSHCHGWDRGDGDLAGDYVGIAA